MCDYLAEIQSDELCDMTDAQTMVYSHITGRMEMCTNRFGIADIDQFAMVEQCCTIERKRVLTDDGWQWLLSVTLNINQDGNVFADEESPFEDLDIARMNLDNIPERCRPVNGKLSVEELQARLESRESTETPLFNESEYDNLDCGRNCDDLRYSRMVRGGYVGLTPQAIFGMKMLESDEQT